MSYARIDRGPMAADVLQRDFTQIHNRLFRDSRLSFKAKGIFGLISTHRNGYGVTPEWIAAAGTEGPSAVKSGLRELERYGYLVRSQARKPDGTMGPMTYSITDMPSSEPQVENRPPGPACEDRETHRSEPVVENPPAADPLAADRVHKKTRAKKTTGENTNRPSVPRASADEEDAAAAKGGTDGSGLVGGKEAEMAAADKMLWRVAAEGAAVLREIAVSYPEYALYGDTLRDQGVMVTSMLGNGWSAEQILHAVVDRPLPVPITTSVGAIVAKRLRDAAAGGVPDSAPGLLPQQASASSPATTPMSSKAAAPAPVRHEPPTCRGCGSWPVPGEDQCAVCLGWPLCEALCGVRLPGGGLCPSCAADALERAIAAPAAEDGRCPGHAGPCGRQAVALGWCSRCRVAAEDAYRSAAV